MNVFYSIETKITKGVWMGILSAFGSFSRVLGPIVVSYVYTNYGTYLVIGLMSASMIIALVLTLVSYKRLVPLKLAPMDETDSGGPKIASL